MKRRKRVYLVGGRTVGATVRVNAGRWDRGTTLTHRWFRDGKVIAKARGKSYRLRRSDVGAKIHAVVTVTKPGHVTVVRETNRTLRITRR